MPLSPALGTVAALASDTDGTLAANSDAVIATQKATKTYVDAHSGGSSDYAIKTANYLAVDGDKLAANTNGGAFTITLPASPASGASIAIVDALSTWATNNLTVARNGQLIESTAANLTADVNGVQITLVFVGGSVGWRVLYQMAQASGSGSGAQSINDQTATGNYTLVLSDAQKLVLVTHGNTVTIPTHASVAYPVGSWVEVNCVATDVQTQLQVVAAGGVSLSWSAGNVTALYVWGQQTVKLRNIGIDTWVATIYSIVPVSGILKADNTGWLTSANAGTDYVAPGGAGTMASDTGWTANADAGDKTQVITDKTSVQSIAAAVLASTSATGVDALLLAMAEKIKSLETALVAFKVPNA
jgi:hypothetical protein